MINQFNDIDQDIQDKIYKRFLTLPLKSKLVIYAKIFHKNSFKAQNNDLFGLNRRSVGKIYRSFIDSLKEDFDVGKNNNTTDKYTTEED